MIVLMIILCCLAGFVGFVCGWLACESEFQRALDRQRQIR